MRQWKAALADPGTVDVIREFVDSGESMSQIAARYGGASRSAVIGFCHRNGIKSPKARHGVKGGKAAAPNMLAKAREAKATKPKKPAKRNVERMHCLHIPDPTTFIPLPEPAPVPPTYRPAGLRFLQLRDDLCKRPLKTVPRGRTFEEQVYCGCPAVPGQSWCDHCIKLVFIPPEERRRRA